MADARPRRGSTLAIAGALILVIAAGAMMLQRAMQQQYLEAHRYAFGEVAVHLAESGLNLFMEHLQEAGERAGTDLHATLVETPVDSVSGVSFPIESPHLAELARLVGPDARLEVWIELRGFRPFLPAGSPRGVVTDPREKAGELAVVARGEYRGVVRTLTASRAVKVVSVVPPVLAKFTLFLRAQGDQDQNPLAYDAFGRRGMRLDGRDASPLVLFHGPDTSPAIVDGRFASLATQFGSQPVDTGGLVYLGGDRPWCLNLVHGVGVGPYEELHLLRRTRYQVPPPRPDAPAEYGLTFGFYAGLFASAKFGAWRSPAGPRDPEGRPIPDRTAALHLYGDRDRVSPTVVLGPVLRRFVTMRLPGGLWYPLRTAAEFEAMGGTRSFPGGWPEYSRIMVRIEEEAYNRGLDYLATNDEGSDDEGRVGAEAMPFVPPSTLDASRLQRVRPAVDGDAGYLYPRPDAPGAGFVKLVRPAGAGREETVFHGALQDLDPELLEQLLVAKVCYRVKDQAELYRRWLRRGALDLPGIVLVEGGDVTLPALRVLRPAMLLVRGNLVVGGRIAGPARGPPLALVSLGGEIRIATAAPVRAALVALRGRVGWRGRLNLAGSLAADRLDLAAMTLGPEAKTIAYDPALDPTDAAAHRLQFRVLVDPTVALRLDGY